MPQRNLNRNGLLHSFDRGNSHQGSAANMINCYSKRIEWKGEFHWGTYIFQMRYFLFLYVIDLDFRLLPIQIRCSKVNRIA
jgi:hypothetical protein